MNSFLLVCTFPGAGTPISCSIDKTPMDTVLGRPMSCTQPTNTVPHRGNMYGSQFLTALQMESEVFRCLETTALTFLGQFPLVELVRVRQIRGILDGTEEWLHLMLPRSITYLSRQDLCGRTQSTTAQTLLSSRWKRCAQYIHVFSRLCSFFTWTACS